MDRTLEYNWIKIYFKDSLKKSEWVCNTIDAHNEGQLYCVSFLNGEIRKYPIETIDHIVEYWVSGNEEEE